ncbi:MAG TPA: Uma2 family endonuclease [Steroidobacteraceae bacterium]|nr:Uma2 family endonuclease [Steroidobacteraceae bacterium]
MQDDLVRRHRLTVQDYYRMAEVGLLAPDAHVELIEGEIIDMPPSGSPHAGILTRLQERLLLAVHGTAIVRSQLALHLDDFSEPEPDIALVKRRSDDYVRSHPTPADVLLVVEVSQTSLRFDRKRKLPLYARHGIPEYWIVDVVKPVLHVFHSPQGERYLHGSSTPQPGMVSLIALPETNVSLTGLFEDL